MIKVFVFLLFWLISVGVISCTSAPPMSPTAAPAPPSVSEAETASSESEAKAEAQRQLWTRRMSGYLTDLDISRDGQRVLISTAPNRESDGGSREHLLMLFDAKGHQRWRVKPHGAVKAQAISDDGALSVVSTYDDTIRAYDANGKMRWSAEAVCKPVILTKTKRVLCYHDDDAEPTVAFDVFDWKGKKLSSFPITNDILALKVSSDERWVAIALTQGGVALFDQELRPLWQKKVEGEIAALDVSPAGPSGEPPVVAVAWDSTDRNRPQRLSLFSDAGAVLRTTEVKGRFHELSFSAQDAFYALNQVTRDSYAAKFDLLLNEKWREKFRRLSNCPPQAEVTGEGILFAVEPRQQQARIVKMASSGERAFELPLASEEGACLYVKSYSEASGVLVTGMDDGTIAAFKLK